MVTDQDIDGEEIVVLSFTNAVVNEIKSRLNDLYNAGGKQTLNKVDIRTFNSFAGQMNFAEKQYSDKDNTKIVPKKQISTYTDSIVQATEYLKRYPEILEGNKHFLIDEIQDLTDSKAHFVLEILKACKEQNISFTLFGDICQAIYDFNPEKGFEMTSLDFYNSVKSIFDKEDLVELKNENHRQTKYLAELTADYRQELLNDNKKELKYALRNIGSNITERALSDICIAIKSCEGEQKFAILASRNGEALNYASSLRRKGIDFTINPSDENEKNKYICASWIAQAFFDNYKNEYMSYKDFYNIVKSKEIELPGIGNKERDVTTKTFWEHLTESFGTSNIQEILKQLYISNGSCDQTVMYTQKPSLLEVSTIHKAKGREFEQVNVDYGFYNYLARLSENDKPQKYGYQHRKMYVGLTRPKKVLSFISPETLDRVDFKPKKKKDKFKNKKNEEIIWYKGSETNPTHVGILEKYIDYDEFNDETENIRQKI